MMLMKIRVAEEKESKKDARHVIRPLLPKSNFGINWKDFGLMVAIGVLSYALFWSFNRIIELAFPWNLLNLLFILGIPFVFYFYRNECKLTDAKFIMAFFGLLVFAIFYLIQALVSTFLNQFSELASSLSFGWGDFKIRILIFLVFSLISSHLAYALVYLVGKIQKSKYDNS